MINAVRSRAETRFDAVDERQRKILEEQRLEAEERRRNTERLKALRLAKNGGHEVEDIVSKIASRHNAKLRKAQEANAEK